VPAAEPPNAPPSAMAPPRLCAGPPRNGSHGLAKPRCAASPSRWPTPERLAWLASRRAASRGPSPHRAGAALPLAAPPRMASRLAWPCFAFVAGEKRSGQVGLGGDMAEKREADCGPACVQKLPPNALGSQRGCRMKILLPPDGKQIWGAPLVLIFGSGAPKQRLEGPLWRCSNCCFVFGNE
jgi:hypothetical protein